MEERFEGHEPVGGGGCEFDAVEFLAGPQDDPARIGLDSHDIARFAEGQAEAFSLADGIGFVAGMAAYDLPGGGDEIAGGFAAPPPFADETSVILVGDEADFLAIGLLSYAEIQLVGHAADFRFSIVAYWKFEPGEEFSLDSKEDVRLVFRLVQSAMEDRAEKGAKRGDGSLF